MQRTNGTEPGNGLDARVQLWDEIEDEFDRLSETGVMFLEPSSTRGCEILDNAIVRLYDAIKFALGVQKDLYSLGLVPPDSDALPETP